MVWEAAPSGKRGLQQTYSDAAIQTCLTIIVLFGMVLRQKTGFTASLLKLAGLDWSVPDFSTLSRRQKALDVSIPYRGSRGPLHLLIDSTGIKVEGEGEWHARKHGGTKRRVWRKIHLGIDEETLKSEPLKSPPTTLAMRQCFQPPSVRLIRTRGSPPSLPTVPMTRADATMSSPTVAPQQSFHPAGTPSRGSQQPLEPGSEMKRCGPRHTSAERSGDAGVSMTDEVVLKRR
jgi:hypothetical protein